MITHLKKSQCWFCSFTYMQNITSFEGKKAQHKYLKHLGVYGSKNLNHTTFKCLKTVSLVLRNWHVQQLKKKVIWLQVIIWTLWCRLLLGKLASPEPFPYIGLLKHGSLQQLTKVKLNCLTIKYFILRLTENNKYIWKLYQVPAT